MSESNKPSMKPVPDPEVSDRPKRRSFTAEYKLNILRELDAITEPGQVGEVLRRAGLYSSHISDWRRLRALGELQALEAKKTGRPKKEHNPLEARLAEAERKAARLEEELRKAHLIIDVQKKYRRCWAWWRAAVAGGPIDRRRGAGASRGCGRRLRRAAGVARDAVSASTAGHRAVASALQPPRAPR